MAKLSSDGNSVTVEKGDSLWAIAATYLGSGAKYTTLAALNGISNPSYIYVGQVLKLNTSGSSSTVTTTSTSSNVATITNFGLQSNSDGTLFAVWSWNMANTANYEIIWEYYTGDNVWFIGTSSNTEDTQSTYTVPDNATQVRFRVKPIAETHTVNDVETSYFTANWCAYKYYYTSNLPPEVPDTPEVTLDKFNLKVEMSNIDEDTKSIQIQIVADDASVFKTATVNVSYSAISYQCTVASGHKYKVRVRALKNSNLYSDWTEYTENVSTIPNTPSGITTCRATSQTTVYLEWSTISTATEYEIEYATNKNYFDNSTQVSSETGIMYNHFEISGLESGNEYFFRLRAINDQGESGWSTIVSCIVGKAPAAPTTWSNSTTASATDNVILYWVHNSEDGSSQVRAQIELITNGGTAQYIVKENSTDEDEKDKTSFYSLGALGGDVTVKWRVRTMGVTGVYGDWSTQRTIQTFAQPTLSLRVFCTPNSSDPDYRIDVTDNGYIYWLPFILACYAEPATQRPIGYYVEIKALSAYETTDNIGNTKTVNINDSVFSQYYNSTDASFEITFDATNCNMDPGVQYSITVIVSMNSGLTETETITVTPGWWGDAVTPNAEVYFSEDTLVTYIRPFVEETIIYYNLVDLVDGVYVVQKYEWGDPIVIETGVYGEKIPGAKIENSDTEWATGLDGLDVYQGVDGEGNEIYYCIEEHRYSMEDKLLSVYRREYDGSFIELATGIINGANTFVVDPHPALDYARYRIVSTDITSGAIGYYDMPGYPTNQKCIVIQWDEAWSNFDVYGDAARVDPPWTGSMLKLPYNVDVSDTHSSEVTKVEYIGRSHPVSYYGTQLGESSTWSTVIPKTDKETLYGLRRLAIWMGDVYVREPSGSGYWANISVAFNQTHNSVTIPVTLNLTRVEGGI